MKKALAATAAFVMLLVLCAPAALAQEVTGGCSATVNGQTLDTLDIKHPLVVEKGDTVTLTGSVPVTAGSGRIESETRIFVEVVGDIPVTTEPGTGPFWGGSVEIPDILTQLAPGVYKVKGDAQGSGWLCTGSAYIRVVGGPLTAATAVGAVLAVAGGAAAIGAIKPKKGQVFHEEGLPGNGSEPIRETSTRLAADVVTLGLFAVLVALVGLLGPSWVI